MGLYGRGFSPNGQTIASVSEDNAIKLWETQGQLQHTLQGHEDRVNMVEFSPDGQTIASASDDKTVKLWDTQGQLLHTLQGHEDRVNMVVFSPDSQTIASISADRITILWDLQELQLKSLITSGCSRAQNYLQYSQDLKLESDRKLCDALL